MLYGRFKKDPNKSLHLLNRYGLRYIVEEGSEVHLSAIIPQGAKGLSICVTGEGKEEACEGINFGKRFPKGLEYLMCSGLKKSQIDVILERNPSIRHLTIERLAGEDDDFKLSSANIKKFTSPHLKTLRLRASITEFENDRVKTQFLRGNRIRELMIGHSPHTTTRIQNPNLETMHFRQRKKIKRDPTSFLLQLLMMRMAGSSEGGENPLNNPILRERMNALRGSMIERESMNMEFYRRSFPNLKRAFFDDVEMKEVIKFLKDNQTCEEVVLDVPGDFEPDSFTRFRNNKVNCFATKLDSETPQKFFRILECFNGLKKLSIICTQDPSKRKKMGNPMMEMMMMSMGMASHVKLDQFVDVNLSTAEMRRIFSKDFCEKIEELELIIPNNDLPLDIANKFKNLKKLCLTCLNFSKVLEPILKNNPSLESLTTINRLKTKHAAANANHGKSVKNIRFFEAYPQSVEILKYNTNLESYIQDSRKIMLRRRWRRGQDEVDPLADRKHESFSKTFPKFEEEGDVQNLPADFPKSKYYFVPPFNPSKIGEEYHKKRNEWEKTTFEYTDSGEDAWEQKGPKGSHEKSLDEADVNIFKKKRAQKLLNEKFSKTPKNPTEEEKKLFGIILNSFAQTYYDNDYDRTDENKSRIYSLVGKGEYFDLEFTDHHRGRSTYCEAFTYLNVKYSRDGENRQLYSTNYDMSNFEKREFEGREILREIKLRLFGPTLLGHVDELDILELLILVGGGRTSAMTWIRQMESGEYREEMRANEDEYSDEEEQGGGFGYSDPKSKEELMFGRGDGILNIKEYKSEVLVEVSFY